MTLADDINELYRTRTDADFAHMEKMLSEHAGEPSTAGSMLAEMLLRLRSMELAERELR